MKTLEILLIIYTFCIVALSIVTYKFYAIRYKYKEKYMYLYNKYAEISIENAIISQHLQDYKKLKDKNTILTCQLFKAEMEVLRLTEKNKLKKTK